ncbi:MAG: aldehyde dehydrogenase family protein, partial [Pseudomonadota bacterium]
MLRGKRFTQPAASHFVAGAPLEDADGTLIESVDPATGVVIARVHAATPAVVDRAVEAAAAAWRDWAARPGIERGRVLMRAAAILRERNRDLSEL